MTCTQCQSTDIVNNLRVIDRTDPHRKTNLQIELDLAPKNILNKGTISATPTANVCINCGFVMFSISPKSAQSFKSINHLKQENQEIADPKKHPKFKEFLKQDHANKHLNLEDQINNFVAWLIKNH